MVVLDNCRKVAIVQGMSNTFSDAVHAGKVRMHIMATGMRGGMAYADPATCLDRAMEIARKDPKVVAIDMRIGRLFWHWVRP